MRCHAADHERVHPGGDRRAQHLQATDAGKALAAVLQVEQEVLRSFSEGERRILLELLQRLARLRKR